MADVAHRLQRLVSIGGSESDADLLNRFVTDRDGPAFAELVSRHGPMVLAVCRRVLRHRQDAEDAFQATFLVLARRAGSVEPQALLGNWLYGVAYRTALSARRIAQARRAREAKAAVRAEGAAPDAGAAPELREALDRELAALPAAYRAAVVACDLEGLSRHAAATRLGWTEGTLSSRLARARALLARRLARYGLGLPVAGLAAVADPAVVCAELAGPTVRLATLVAAGEAAVAAPLAALMEGPMRAMFLTKFKALLAAAVVGCAVAVTAAAGWRADTVAAEEPKQPVEAPKRAAPEDPKQPPETPKRVTPNSDKDRIAELERERERLLKLVVELQDRLTKVEAEQQATAMRALDQVLRAREAFRATEALRAREEAQRRALPKTPEAAPTTPRIEPVPNGPAREPAPGGPQPGSGTRTPKEESAPKGADPLGPAAKPAPREQAVVRVYPVGPLAGDEKEGEALAKVVRAVVEPKSWGADAGVEYLPGKKVLVVRQTNQGHKEVADLLELLQAMSAPPGKR
jgi:RNA polymerase sigma factor (sigma-70 family)